MMQMRSGHLLQSSRCVAFNTNQIIELAPAHRNVYDTISTTKMLVSLENTLTGTFTTASTGIWVED